MSFRELAHGDRKRGPFVPVYPSYAKAFGGFCCAGLLGYLIFREEYADEEGWISLRGKNGQKKGLAKVEKDTGLTTREVRTARSKFEESGAIESRKNHVTGDLRFRLNWDVLDRLWERSGTEKRELEQPPEPIRDKAVVKTSRASCQNDNRSSRKSLKISNRFGSSTPLPNYIRSSSKEARKSRTEATGVAAALSSSGTKTNNKLQSRKRMVAKRRSTSATKISQTASTPVDAQETPRARARGAAAIDPKWRERFEADMDRRDWCDGKGAPIGNRQKWIEGAWAIEYEKRTKMKERDREDAEVVIADMRARLSCGPGHDGFDDQERAEYRQKLAEAERQYAESYGGTAATTRPNEES